MSESEPRRRRHRRVVRKGTEQQAVSGVSRDERAEGWSERGSASGADQDGSRDSAHDAELRRNKPPHWS